MSTITDQIPVAPLKKEVETKTYTLLATNDPTAPIFIQVSATERVRVSKRKSEKPYLQHTFATEDGVTRTARLKLGARSIWLDEQAKEGIDANAKFTQAERDAVHFKQGTLNTSFAIVQTYLEAIPQFNEFKGQAIEDVKPLYKLYSRSDEVKSHNEEIRRRTKAVSKVLGMKLNEAQDMLIGIYGSFYQPSKDLDECQNQIINEMDANPEVIEKVLRVRLPLTTKLKFLLAD